MKIDLKDYHRNRVDKRDMITTGINLARYHKIFLDNRGINLSALIRDVIDALMLENTEVKNEPKKTKTSIKK